MLVGLRLENIALIESLELNFQRGFSVFTGETGTGKSIFLDALDALFAGNQARSSFRLLRDGTTKSQVEARFLGNAAVDSWLKAEGFEIDDDEIVISREWRFNDNRWSNRCRLNGVVVNRHQINALRPLLIDLTVQGETQYLGSSSNQLCWIDRLGSIELKEVLDRVKNSWIVWQQTFISLENAKAEKDKLKKQYDDLEHLLQDLEAAELNDPFEDVQLKIEEDRLVNSYKLQNGLANLLSRLQEGYEESPSVLDHLKACVQELKMMVKLDSSLSIYLDKAFDFHANLNELILEFEKYGSLINNDSSRLEKVQERLLLLTKLQRRYNHDLPSLLQRRDELRSFQAHENVEKLIEELHAKEKFARQERDKNNIDLTNARRKVAHKFENNLMKYLRPLGLLNVRFKIKFLFSDPSDNGSDAVQFLFSANPGQSLAPLMEIASGGEMSRFLLALKTVLSDIDGSNTLLFDEIDAGVSGRVSAAIANVLKELAVKRQVFCITHQPLVAAVADHHFRISKSVENGVTRSYVLPLSDIQDRQKELAELAGGDFVGASVYAASLLDHQAA